MAVSYKFSIWCKLGVFAFVEEAVFCCVDGDVADPPTFDDDVFNDVPFVIEPPVNVLFVELGGVFDVVDDGVDDFSSLRMASVIIFDTIFIWLNKLLLLSCCCFDCESKNLKSEFPFIYDSLIVFSIIVSSLIPPTDWLSKRGCSYERKNQLDK